MHLSPCYPKIRDGQLETSFKLKRIIMLPREGSGSLGPVAAALPGRSKSPVLVSIPRTKSYLSVGDASQFTGNANTLK